MNVNDIAYLSQILHKADALKEILEQEFSALKDQDLVSFEKLQQKKNQILEFLSNEEFLNRAQEYRATGGAEKNGQPPANLDNLTMWEKIIKTMTDSRKLHQRNEILINSKIESIRSALRTIQTPDPLSSVEVYDKLGKLTGSTDRNKVGDA
ncbi:MAG: flagellar export chaperone FlgN [Pseudomonadota bacterium]|nr:flagellar export chaperone FlgN [Pseudomonadota bacterium]